MDEYEGDKIISERLHTDETLQDRINIHQEIQINECGKQENHSISFPPKPPTIPIERLLSSPPRDILEENRPPEDIPEEVIHLPQYEEVMHSL